MLLMDLEDDTAPTCIEIRDLSICPEVSRSSSGTDLSVFSHADFAVLSFRLSEAYFKLMPRTSVPFCLFD